MKAALAVATLLWTASVFAQYPGAPARDVKDAVRLLQEAQRLIEPAIAGVRDQVAVFGALSKAEKQLKESQPASSFDDATKVIDEFERRRNEVDPPLSRELQRTIADARQILAINKPILNVVAARERLHHDVVHPLQRDLMRSAGDLQQLTQQLQFMQGRMFAQVMPDIFNATAYAATEAPK